jgi:hypothetical protein
VPSHATSVSRAGLPRCGSREWPSARNWQDLHRAATGALIMGVLNNGGNLLAIDAFYLQIAIGALILVAVGFDQWNTRAASRSG